MDSLPEMPRLDVLIYAHDGRGLGHASRSIAIGLALRRLAPDLRILFLSGCSFSQDLIGDGILDWLKLPSYETEVVEGKSKGIKSKSGFEDDDLGRIRAEQIKLIFSQYRPRLVLADHSPQGKHKELLPALELSKGSDTKWILGVRGVIGGVSQTIAELPAIIFKNSYFGLLWYGDSKIIGREHLDSLSNIYQVDPVECGYVSRLAESSAQKNEKKTSFAGVISIPWLGEHSHTYLATVTALLERVGNTYGQWKMFLDLNTDSIDGNLRKRLLELNNCTVEKPGKSYAKALEIAKIAMIYGGYNSLVDVLYLDMPALVCMRAMRDREQQLHLESLKSSVPDRFYIYEEETVSADQLEAMVREAFNKSSKKCDVKVNLNGAENAAEYILSALHKFGS